MKTQLGRAATATLRNIGIVTVLNAGVALVAFFKDIVLANYLGTSPEADSFSIAMYIPDALGNNLIAAAIHSACVPLFARAAAGERNPAVAKAAAHALGAGLAVFAAVAVAVPWLAALFHTGESARLTRILLWLMLPTVLVFPLKAVAQAALQAEKRFHRPAAAPILFNAVWLFAAAACAAAGVGREAGAMWISVGFTAGVCAGLYYLREPLLRSLREIRSGLPRIALWGTTIPYAGVLLGTQAVFFVERYFAARLGEAVVAGLTYAFRLSQVPIWTAIAAINAVMLPTLSEEMAGRRLEEAGRTLSRAIAAGLAVTLPTAALLYILREPAIAVLFQRGAFDEASTRLTSLVLEGYAWAIPLQATALIGLRYYLAKGRLRVPLLIAGGGAAVTVAADWALIPAFGPAGIGYGAALGACLQAALYLALLAGRERMVDGEAARRMLRIFAANAVAAAAVARLAALEPVRAGLADGVERWLWLPALAAAYAALVSAAAWLFGKRRGERT